MIVYNEKLLAIMDKVADLDARMQIYAVALNNLQTSGLMVTPEMIEKIIRVSVRDITSFQRLASEYAADARSFDAEADANFLHVIERAKASLDDAADSLISLSILRQTSH